MQTLVKMTLWMNGILFILLARDYAVNLAFGAARAQLRSGAVLVSRDSQLVANAQSTQRD